LLVQADNAIIVNCKGKTMRIATYATYTALAAAVALTAGCANMTEAQQGAARGAGIGAIAGTVIGAAADGRDGALRGAVIGAGVGAIGGHI